MRYIGELTELYMEPDASKKILRGLFFAPWRMRKEPTSMSSIENLIEDQFKKKVLQGEKPTVIDFYDTTFGPCKVLSYIVEELAEEFSGKINTYKVNVDTEPSLSSTFKIMGVPTLLFFKDGKEIHRHAGVLPKERLHPLYERLIRE